jgi:hypothetical protein
MGKEFFSEKVLDSQQSLGIYIPNQSSSPETVSQINQELNNINNQ